VDFYRIETVEQAQDLVKILPEVVAIDTEYVKGDPRTTQLLSIIIADDKRAWTFPPSLLHVLTPAIRARRLVFLQDYNHCDTIVLYKGGCDIRDQNCFNLIDMHHLLDENAEHDLGSRVLLEFKDAYKKVFWGKYKNFEDADPEEALEYQCKDAIYTYRLGIKDYEELYRDKKLSELYAHVRKLSRALLDTELAGVCVDVELMKHTKQEMSGKIAGYLPKLREEFDEYCKIWEMEKWCEKIKDLKSIKGKLNAKRPEFSFTSDKQISWLLYDALKLPVIEKTKKGNPSTDFDTLKTLSEDYPEIATIVEYKEVKSIYSTFVEGMLERVDNGRIYPHFNVSGTATGRISHTDPNMGNLPKEGIIRNFFLPSPGMVIIGADYAQLEVVVELNLTEDPGLKRIVLGGESKHDLFKADLDKAGFNLPRSQVKNVNFALQYGAGAKKIAKMVGCDETTSNQIIDVFYTTFNGVKQLKNDVNVTLAREGMVTNLAGRIRRFEATENKYEVYRQQRQAYNFLIQGVAGEACNRAYYRFAAWCKENRCGRALFSVHDEIVAEVPPNKVEEATQALISIMEASTEDFSFKYPLKAAPYGPLNFWTKT